MTWHNTKPNDPYRHAMSAKGIKTITYRLNKASKATISTKRVANEEQEKDFLKRMYETSPKAEVLKEEYEKPKKELDGIAIDELVLFAQNDSQLYDRRITPYINLFAKKIKNGTYNEDLAIQGLTNNVVKDAQNRYNQEFGAGSMKLNPAERKEVAKQMLPYIKESAEYKLKNEMK